MELDFGADSGGGKGTADPAEATETTPPKKRSRLSSSPCSSPKVENNEVPEGCKWCKGCGATKCFNEFGKKEALCRPCKQ
eukprot:13864420-Alexandrium_andersonii.AAC.1